MKKNPSNNEVVVITGASAGVGRATAHEFGRRGAKVGLIARNLPRLEAAKKDVEDLGGTAMIFPADIADAGQVESAAEEIEKVLGPIDIWINNAMVSIFSRVSEMSPKEYLRVT
jgi:short-subunit dehydrogenase